MLRMSGELINLISRRLKTHSVAFLMNTLTLMYTLSINLDAQPELRDALADVTFYERFHKLVLVRDPRIRAAVLQLLVDWEFLFRRARARLGHCERSQAGFCFYLV